MQITLVSCQDQTINVLMWQGGGGFCWYSTSWPEDKGVEIVHSYEDISTLQQCHSLHIKCSIIHVLQRLMIRNHPADNYNSNEGLQSGLSVPIIQYFWSHSRLILDPNQCVILAGTHSMKIRVNTWISPAIVCLLKDQVRTIIKLFFEIGTVIDP